MISGQYSVLSYVRWKQKWRGSVTNNADFSSLGSAVIAYLDSFGPQTVIEEAEYVDSDYLAAYAFFYSTNFRPPPPFCTRFLFFSTRFGTIEELHDREKKDIIDDAFCGFIVLWPTEPPVIGRSVLRFPKLNKQGITTIKVAGHYKVHVAGRGFELESAMFASKDHVVSACATIATWLSTDIMHRRFDLRTCASTEITRLATGENPKWGRAFPQRYGLDAQQMTKALTELDYGPYVYDFEEPRPSETLDWVGPLYGYLSSGIPVIIVCDVNRPVREFNPDGTPRLNPDGTPKIELVSARHAILAIGLNTSDEKLKSIGGDTSEPRSLVDTVESILVHDDRWGPFGTLKPPTDRQSAADISYPDGFSMTAIVKQLIVPLPTSVVLESAFAHRLGINILKQNTVVSDYTRGWYCRTFLTPSIELKTDTITWDSDLGIAGRIIRSTAMPRWVWITEAYFINDAEQIGDKPDARVILDSTQLHVAGNRLLFLMGHVRKRIIPPVP